ncbi:hypothetical protein LTR22_006054 [Elasticomyces elasticus]|nr:hypothetical protein LTR22_006054 [Elasticomyces elasticus]KAK4924041.1 hypothetical protein LTR49_008781 [Elasticomyces elasticus]KAK5764398.1 hypothetical protein LTS12_005374 [Elasticomyces elasticus]
MDTITDFGRTHVAQLTGTAGLVSYALLRKKLTPDGIAAGIFVAFVHMLHPWQGIFWLLIVFFLLGTIVTRAGHAAKAQITQSSGGGGGGEGARTSAQVFANSGTACVLILLHLWVLSSSPFISSTLPVAPGPHLPLLSKLLPIGTIAQYAAVAADTFSSELGILSQSKPFLITAPWKRVPAGTNGGVTLDGLLYGGLGSVLLVQTAALTLKFLPPHIVVSRQTAALLTLAGFLGTVIDSLLGAVVQATVTDKKTGRVVEGHGGTRVKAGSERVQMGWDLLTNNGVNFAMAALTSMIAMGAAWAVEANLGTSLPSSQPSSINALTNRGISKND